MFKNSPSILVQGDSCLSDMTYGYDTDFSCCSS